MGRGHKSVRTRGDGSRGQCTSGCPAQPECVLSNSLFCGVLPEIAIAISLCFENPLTGLLKLISVLTHMFFKVCICALTMCGAWQLSFLSTLFAYDSPGVFRPWSCSWVP